MRIHLPFGKQPDERSIYPHYVEHPGQREITKALKTNFALPEAEQANIIEMICGRGWGKTLYFVCKILIPYLNTHPNAKVMWVAPSYLVAQSPIEDVFRGFNEQTGERWVEEFDPQGTRVWDFATTRSGPVLTWWNGATVTFRSAEAPESIVSRGYNLIILDEAALIDEKVFMLQILGTARKAGIKIFAITTPRGKKHWTYKFFMKGQDASEKNYLSFQQNYMRNPYFNKTQAQILKDIPEWVYRQEYLAEFIEDGDIVFRGLSDVLDGASLDFPTTHQEWSAGLKDVEFDTPEGKVQRRAGERRFVVGLDLAKSQDYTVYWVMDCETGETVHYKRINKTDYKEILATAAKLCKEFNGADLIFDATGVGGGLADMMSNYDVVAHPFIFTNDTKNELVTRLALAIEHKQIKIPNITTVVKELSIFSYSITRTGKMSYSAPSGQHDDTVMALALANWFRMENSGSDQVGVIDDIIAFNSGRAQGPTNFREWMDDDND